MIIYGPADLTKSYSELLAGLNLSPKVGDGGHPEDHARLASLLFDVPQLDMPVASAFKENGEWSMVASPHRGDPAPSTWAQVRETMEKPGIICYSGDEYADGVTDYTDDTLPDGAAIIGASAGLAGLSHQVSNLVLLQAEDSSELDDLRNRVSALESGGG